MRMRTLWVKMKSRRSSLSSTSGREETPVRWGGCTSLTGKHMYMCMCMYIPYVVSVPGKRPLPGKRPCTAYHGATVHVHVAASTCIRMGFWSRESTHAGQNCQLCLSAHGHLTRDTTVLWWSGYQEVVHAYSTSAVTCTFCWLSIQKQLENAMDGPIDVIRFRQQQEDPKFLSHFGGKFIIHWVNSHTYTHS